MGKYDPKVVHRYALEHARYLESLADRLKRNRSKVTRNEEGRLSFSKVPGFDVFGYGYAGFDDVWGAETVDEAIDALEREAAALRLKRTQKRFAERWGITDFIDENKK